MDEKLYELLDKAKAEGYNDDQLKDLANWYKSSMPAASIDKPKPNSLYKQFLTEDAGPQTKYEKAPALMKPVVALGQGIQAALTDMIPGGVASGTAGMMDTDFDKTIISSTYPQVSTPVGPVKQNITDEMKVKAIEAFKNKYGVEEYNRQKKEYAINIGRKKSELLSESDTQDLERQEKMRTIPQDTKEVNSITDAASYLSVSTSLNTSIASLSFPYLL